MSGDFDDLSKNLKCNIGYINIPQMYNYEDVECLENFIEETLKNLADTKALM